MPLVCFERDLLMTTAFEWLRVYCVSFGRHSMLPGLGLFVTIENNRLVYPPPKRKVARWNRGGTTFPKEIGTSPPLQALSRNLSSHFLLSGTKRLPFWYWRRS